jgi:hypothetical protein
MGHPAYHPVGLHPGETASDKSLLWVRSAFSIVGGAAVALFFPVESQPFTLLASAWLLADIIFAANE